MENIDLESRPRQIEFARLGINRTVMSKRKLRALVESGMVEGWDDPRMPTLCGLRRRGYTPESIKTFCERIGVSKVNSTVDYAFLEHCLREHLNETARRVMVVLDPVRLTITNYPADLTESFEIENNPQAPDEGKRMIPFSRDLWIERDDFMEEPVKGYRRFYPGNEVRLKSAYVVRCTGCRKDENGTVTEVLAEYDPLTKGGNTHDDRKIKATVHWVDSRSCIGCEVRLYDHLFSVEDPDTQERDFREYVDPYSLKIMNDCKAEPSVADAAIDRFQFLRLGYFYKDKITSAGGSPVFNRSVSLKDSFRQPAG